MPEVLDNGEVTDGTHVPAGQLALALTPYAHVADLAVNTAASGNNAAAIQSLDDPGQQRAGAGNCAPGHGSGPPTHDTTQRLRQLGEGVTFPQDRVHSKKTMYVMQNHECHAQKPCMSCKNHAKSCHAKTMQNHVMHNHAKSCHAKTMQNHVMQNHAKSHRANVMHKPCKITPCQNHAKSCKTSYS